MDSVLAGSLFDAQGTAMTNAWSPIEEQVRAIATDSESMNLRLTKLQASDLRQI